MLAHDRGRFVGIDRGGVGTRGAAQHRALLEQVDVAADEGVRVGAQQRDHRLVAVDALLARQRAGNLRQGLATLHGDAAIGRHPGRCGRDGRRRGRTRSGGPCGHRCGARGGVGCRRGRSDRRRCRLGIAHDGVGHRPGRGDDLRFGHGQRAVGRIDQGRVLTDQAALAPIGFDQEIERGGGDRGLGADPHHRPALCIAGELELQLADQPDRALQPDPGKGDRRGQRHAQVLQFGRIGGNDRNFGQQRLAGLGQHPDIAQAQGHGGAADQGQHQRGDILERAQSARSPVLHGGQYNGSPRDRRCFVAQAPAASPCHRRGAISLRRRPVRPTAPH
ncbi:hypothetical protein D3C71_1210480 [compost metagenome]